MPRPESQRDQDPVQPAPRVMPFELGPVELAALERLLIVRRRQPRLHLRASQGWELTDELGAPFRTARASSGL
jgi:hypothetical protein